MYDGPRPGPGTSKPPFATVCKPVCMRRGTLALLVLLLPGALFTASAAGQGRTTMLCHFTGSQTTPYVLVEAPEGGGEHAAHAQDLIPAPPGGCPAAAQAPPTTPAPAPPPPAPVTTPAEPASVTLCHFVRGGYVEITVRPRQAAAHRGHPRDIIPAPYGGCPPASPVEATPPTVAKPAPKPAPVPTRTATLTPRPAPAGTASELPAAPVPAVRGPGTVAGGDRGLAYTGYSAWYVLWAGLGLMLTATGVHLRSRR
jgi:hypothetical protein